MALTNETLCGELGVLPAAPAVTVQAPAGRARRLTGKEGHR
jgi:hypothetical protein